MPSHTAPPPPPIRIFVGCSPAERIPANVLAHSIRRHATPGREVEVRFLHECTRPLPPITVTDARPRTNFSYQRFCIPEACGFEGRGIYLDSDQLVFADIAELFDAPMPDGVNVLSACPIGLPHQNSSVMVIDCAKTPWRIDDLIARINAGGSGALTYSQLMRLENIGVKWAPAPGDHQWNCLDTWTPRTKLLHFTDMGKQPWLNRKPHPLAKLWFDAKADMEAAAAQKVSAA